MNRILFWVISLGLFFVLGQNFLQASRKEFPGTQEFARTRNGFTPGYQTLFNINQLAGWLSRNGVSGMNPHTQDAGVWYPRGTATVIFADGFLWGGIPDTSTKKLPRVGGNTYQTGWQPGRIIAPGVAQSPDDPSVRVYRIRRDWETVSLEELRRDAAELFNQDESEITEEMIEQVRSWYQRDWQEWPVEAGAPFYDTNANGVYEPELGETPGLLGADQVLWFVVNDLDTAQMSYFYGSQPVGLEMQVTMWAYRDSAAVGQAVFQRYRLINKSGVGLDSVFISRWMDVDVGNFTDDLVGCDSLLNLAFGYNATPVDAQFQPFNLPPAAIGCVLLDGPRGESGTTLPMTSFVYFATGSPIPDPTLGDYEGTRQWYLLMNGYTSIRDPNYPDRLIPYYHGAGPYAGRPTRFPLNGNPLTGVGDVDGIPGNLPGGGRRMAMSSGPFRLAPGDTQTVTFALVGGIVPDGDHLSSVQQLKENVRTIIGFYRYGVYPRPPQVVTEFPDGSHTRFSFRIDLSFSRGIQSARIMAHPEAGSEPEIELELYDDGNHDDGAAGDGIWGNSLTVTNRKYPYQVNLYLQNDVGDTVLSNIMSPLTLRPAPVLTNPRVVWENGRPDGHINQGEKVHLIFDIINPDEVNAIDTIRLASLVSGVYRYQTLFSDGIPPGGVLYGDSADYLEFIAPTSGDSAVFRLREWWDFQVNQINLTLPVVRWKPHALRGDTLPVEIVKGHTANAYPVVTSPADLTGHLYAISFLGPPDSLARYWRLYDVTAHQILLDSVAVATDDHADFPVVDAIEWRIYQLPVTIQAIVEVANQDGPLPPEEWDEAGTPYHGNNVWHDASARSDVNRFFLSAGGNGSLESLLRFGPAPNDHDLEIRFTDRGGIYMWWYDDDSWAQVPFEAWDVGVATYDDPSDDVRALTGGYSGGTATGSQGFRFDYVDPFSALPATDWIYLRVPIDSLGTYQIFYDDVTSGTHSYSWWNHSREVLSRLIFCDFSGNNALPLSGTVVRVVTTKLNYSGDSLLVQAPTARMDSLYGLAVRYQLTQNFPNPFNAMTNIFYSVSERTHVCLEVFNILGQRVKTLVDGDVPEGEYLIRWDGNNEQGIPLASGVYLLRFKAGGVVQVKKMVLIR